MGVKTIAGESGGIDWLASVGPQSNGFEFNFHVPSAADPLTSFKDVTI